MKEKKDYLIKLLKNFDEKLDGDLEFQYRNRECSTKEFLQNLINKEIPFWLENNSNDLDWTILLKGFNECFKELLKDWDNNKVLFDLGKTVMTRRIKYEMDNGNLDYRFILNLLILHSQNISDSCNQDRESNLEDIKSKSGRVLNRYKNSVGDIFIDTNLGNENNTIVMFCDEY